MSFGRFFLVFFCLSNAWVGAISPVDARPATCVIRASGGVYSGKCDFIADKGNGGFSVAPIGAKYFPDGINPISLYKTGPAQAEVRGLTRDGVNSRWGPAKRSTRDPACWTGDDFSICAY
jgi:hypothetical protein